MSTCFFYGTLCHLPLLQAVLGHLPRTVPATLDGHRVFWAEGGNFPVIVAAPGATAAGLLVQELSAQDLARLDYYEGGFEYRLRSVLVTATAEQTAEPRMARVYFPPQRVVPAEAPWDLAAWQARWAALVVSAAGDYMLGFGTPEAAVVQARYPMLLVRAASRLRAQAGASLAAVRRDATPRDVDLIRRRQPYANFFAVEELDLRHSQFGGGMTPVLNRAVFVSGDAATVLPYDPVRDRVLLVEQFRPGPFVRGDRQPWQLEAIAGRVDPGETPQQAAMREAVEEAGVHLRSLLPIAEYYPSPGGKSEFLYSYLGLADLPDTAAGLGGLVEEGEDIRAHLVSFDALIALIASGEVANAPLILSAWWLAARRDALRAAPVTGA